MSKDGDNIISMGFNVTYPELRRLHTAIGEVINQHLDNVPLMGVIGVLDFIKHDLTSQALSG